MSLDNFYMLRCVQLAKNGFGTTYPNPLVGSVIVYQNQIIGEGWHQKSGFPHAEVNAINSVIDKSLLTKATLYVNLEPCCHFGKTPPCADLIVSYKIPRVVIGTTDPNEKVAGKGIEKLIESGCNVIVGVETEACYELNKRFFLFHNQKRPYIILKWAETSDGFIAPIKESSNSAKQPKPYWITNTYSRQLVHKWRTEEQAILIGTQTALDDNPVLNARDFYGNHPVRIVLDKSGRIKNHFHIKDNTIKTIIITETDAFKSTTNCIYEFAVFNENLIDQILTILLKHNIQSVIIEGGAQTIQTFIDTNVWDEARIFVNEVEFKSGTKAPTIKGKIISKTTILNDTLTIKNYDKSNNF
ncbi:MAG TPA: bifunctional diaminohydroxyphosphoribosylaminopyrimidine deaminase/5-amino-6-(5-phosphoribosylamino)uracil reductase RibD [Flavobacterium sp.]|nr:bifunctional diaminohydroxyphosphoribosylaminopyrimidine deaminase/5-amino-6-(5-phosphoribosylamino)uracil reductase RibD [Flavobacterium sp.]